MNSLKLFFRKMKQFIWLGGFVLGVMTFFAANQVFHYTSRNEFCDVCHVHPHSTSSWQMGPHKDTKSGVVTNCVDCHLPPGGLYYVTEKIRVGVRDVWGTVFKDTDKINWELKSRREHAIHFTYNASCRKCHQNLFSRGLSKKGEDAHLYFDQQIKVSDIRCINCHLDVGHHQEKPVETMELAKTEGPKEKFTGPAVLTSFENFTEQIPGTRVSFEMIALPGGEFTIGSPTSEPYREPDEGPQRRIRISPFWIGKAEVSWDEYGAFINQCGAQGRTEDQYAARGVDAKIDVITGPTPAYGNPDQGWGKGQRPAITMTHYAAEQYCKWLSKVTGKTYRLPTEAEWEYSARANTAGAYFFPGDPKKYTSRGFWNRFTGIDTTTINSYVIYAGNSGMMTHPPDQVKPNPFGLVHTLGNVKEFCLDSYQPDIYSTWQDGALDPCGPMNGKEYVVRGGSYKDDAADVRIANRDHTHFDAWMMTDPQIPKSLWWYSDNNEVGFRVVCEYEGAK